MVVTERTDTISERRVREGLRSERLLARTPHDEPLPEGVEGSTSVISGDYQRPCFRGERV